MAEDATSTDPRHRVAAFVASTREDLSDLAEVAVWSMTPHETASTLLQVSRLKAQIAGKRILDVVSPEIGEAREARLLDAEEADDRAAASFTWTRTVTASATAGSPSPA